MHYILFTKPNLGKDIFKDSFFLNIGFILKTLEIS